MSDEPETIIELPPPLDPAAWDDMGMTWDDPDPTNPLYLRAIYKAINERLLMIRGTPWGGLSGNINAMPLQWMPYNVFLSDWTAYIRKAILDILDYACFDGMLPPNGDAVYGTVEPLAGVWPGVYMHGFNSRLRLLDLPSGMTLRGTRTKVFLRTVKYFLDLCVMYPVYGTLTWDYHSMPDYNTSGYDVDNYDDYFNALLADAFVKARVMDIAGNISEFLPRSFFERSNRFGRGISTNIAYRAHDWVLPHDLYVRATSDTDFLGASLPVDYVRYTDYSGTGISDGECRAIGRAKSRAEAEVEAEAHEIDVEDVDVTLPIGGSGIAPPTSWGDWDVPIDEYPTVYPFSFDALYANYNVAGGFRFADKFTRTALEPGELVDYSDPE